MQTWHWAILALAFFVLFGYKKLPDAARGLGRSMRIFKSEIKEMQKDDENSKLPSSPALPPVSGVDFDNTQVTTEASSSGNIDHKAV